MNRLRENILENIMDSYSVGFDNGEGSREPLHEYRKVNAILSNVIYHLGNVFNEDLEQSVKVSSIISMLELEKYEDE